MIREATTDDCVKLAALSIKVWLETYSKNGIQNESAEYVLSAFTSGYFLKLLNSTEYQLLVGEESGALQGYVLANLKSHYQTPSNGFEIEKLYIDSAFKGRGLGRALLNEVEATLGKRYWLYTWVENESNGFYQHLGFNQIGLLTFDFFGQLIENNVYCSAHIE